MKHLTAKIELRCERALKLAVEKIAAARHMSLSNLTRQRFLADPEIRTAFDEAREQEAHERSSKKGAKR